MPLRVQCSAGHLMMVPDHRAGTVLRCPNCGIEVQVPGEPVGPAKALSQPKLQTPTLARSPGIPAISGAGEQSPQVAGRSPAPQSRLPAKAKLKPQAAPKPPPEPAKPTKKAVPPPLQTPALARKPGQPALGAEVQSPQVAGHSTSARSGIGSAAARLSAKPKLKPPTTFRQEPPEVGVPASAGEAVQPESTFQTPAPLEPEILWTEAPPVTAKSAAASAKTPPAGEDIVFADLQTKPPPTAKPGKNEAPKPRWQTEPAHPAPPKPVSTRPRSTLTGTILADPAAVEPVAPPSVAPLLRKEPAPGKARWVDGPPEIVTRGGEFSREGEAPAEQKPVGPEVQPPFVIEAPPIVPAVDSPLSLHSAATVVEPNRPPLLPAPPVVVMQGVQPTASQRITVWQLAAALLAATLLSIGPSIWEIGDYLSSDSGPAVALWAFFLLVLGVIQIGCLALLIQVPDWSSVWIVTIQSLVLAALYAALLGLTVITGGNSTLIDALDLDVQYASGKAPMWCVCLAATYACLALFAGRFSAKWYKVLRQVQLSDEAGYAH